MDKSVDSLLDQGKNLADKATDHAQAIGKRSVNALNDAAKQARNAASDASDSLIAYTKKNPAKALLIAAASGALLVTLLKAVAPSRD